MLRQNITDNKSLSDDGDCRTDLKIIFSSISSVSINCLKSEPAAMPRSYMNHCCSKSSKRNCLRFSLIHLDNQKETKSVVSNEAACYGKCSLWTTLLQIKPFISIYPKQKQHKICISSLYISASEYWDMALWNTDSNSEVGYIVRINSS